jgi:hypothetical protein
MEFAIHSVVDPTRLAAIAVELHAMARTCASFVQNHAKSAAFTQSVTNNARNLARHALRTVRGPVHIVDDVHYRVLYLVTSCHAQSAVQRH